jgi:hypothetical protein
VPSISFYTILMLHNQVMESGWWMFLWTKMYTFSFHSWGREWVIDKVSVWKISTRNIKHDKVYKQRFKFFQGKEKVSLKTIYPNLGRILHSNFTAFNFVAGWSFFLPSYQVFWDFFSESFNLFNLGSNEKLCGFSERNYLSF